MGMKPRGTGVDELQQSVYADRFKASFHSKGGTEFQDWFVTIAGHSFGADFEEVRPYGAQGDLKCDGRNVSDGTVFQCYAPYQMKDVEVIAKVDADFHGARKHWSSTMSKWVFVHNDGRGLAPGVIQHLDKIRAAHPEVAIEVWSEPELLNLAMGLGLHQLQALFGYAPSAAIVDRLVLADIVPIIDALEQSEPDPDDPPLTPPSVQKLEKNALSADSATLLRYGRRRSDLVRTFFMKSPRPEMGERIAESFRSRYAELKALQLPADKIFGHLQSFAGMNGEPKRQGAALAVLAYFFESCDIFEDPDVLGDVP
jgi:hypothetical protein